MTLLLPYITFEISFFTYVCVCSGRGMLRPACHFIFTARRSARRCICCRRMSVCLSQAGIVLKQLDRLRWFWHGGFFPLSPKQGYFPLELCPNCGLRIFCHDKSVVLSTKLVDSWACWHHLDGGWCVVAVFYTSISCNLLRPKCHYIMYAAGHNAHLIWFLISALYILFAC